MNYEQLKRMCTNLRIPVGKVADECGLTLDGLKKGINSESLALRYIVPLCKSLCIDPNTFFSFQPQKSGDVNYGQMQKNGKKQIMHTGSEETIKLLQTQLEIKDAQIKEKDAQIAQLISKL